VILCFNYDKRDARDKSTRIALIGSTCYIRTRQASEHSTHRSHRQHVSHSHSTGERAQQRSMFTTTPPFAIVVEQRTPLSCLSTQGHRRRVRTMSHGLHLLVLVSRVIPQCEGRCGHEVNRACNAFLYTSLGACPEDQHTQSSITTCALSICTCFELSGCGCTSHTRSTHNSVGARTSNFQRVTCNPRVLSAVCNQRTCCVRTSCSCDVTTTVSVASDRDGLSDKRARASHASGADARKQSTKHALV
jgi:hypothetical protein